MTTEDSHEWQKLEHDVIKIMLDHRGVKTREIHWNECAGSLVGYFSTQLAEQKKKYQDAIDFDTKIFKEKIIEQEQQLAEKEEKIKFWVDSWNKFKNDF